MKTLKHIVTFIVVVTLFAACGNDNKFDPWLSINGNSEGVSTETVTSLNVFGSKSSFGKNIDYTEYDDLGNPTYTVHYGFYTEPEDGNLEPSYSINYTYEYDDMNHIISGKEVREEPELDDEITEYTYEYEYGDNGYITRMVYMPDIEINSKQTANFTYETDGETGDITVTAAYDYSFGLESGGYELFGDDLPYEDTYIFTKDGVIKEQTSITNKSSGYGKVYTQYNEYGDSEMRIYESGADLEDEETIDNSQIIHYQNFYDEAGYLYGKVGIYEYTSVVDEETKEEVTEYSLYNMYYYNTTYGDGSISTWIDEDDDYFFADIDCDDTDEDYFKPEVEACEGSNNNAVKYSDTDGTSVGDSQNTPEDSDETCTNFKYVCNGKDMDHDGFTEEDGDCDDTNYYTNPEASETCDGEDNDCDGEIDEGVTDMYTWYVDSDGDGWGSTDEAVNACVQPEDYVSNSGDCNDDIYSLANTDCGEEEPPVTKYTYYRDSDGDGYGNPYSSTEAESQPSGYVTNDDDCNDSDDNIHPDRKDCAAFGGKYLSLGGDGKDNDCDGQIDEDTCGLQFEKAPKFK